MVSYGEVFNPVFGHLDRYIPICVQKNLGGPPPAWPLMFFSGKVVREEERMVPPLLPVRGVRDEEPIGFPPTVHWP